MSVLPVKRLPIADDLDLRRLRHRERRLDAVLRELRSRAEGYPPGRARLVGRAIEGFEGELAVVRRRLTELHGPPRAD
jgi:hypothetical protein